jgi:hypothetical protein
MAVSGGNTPTPHTGNQQEKKNRDAAYWRKQPLRPGHPRWKKLSPQQRAAVRAANRVFDKATTMADFFGPQRKPFFGKFMSNDKNKGGGGKPKGGQRPVGHGGHKHGSGGGGKSMGGGGGGGGGGAAGGGMRYYGAGKAPKVSRDAAAIIVGREINKQLRELQREGGKTRRAGRRAVTEANNHGQKVRGDLDYLFNEADDFIGAQNTKIDGQYDQQRAQLQDLFNSVQGEQSQATDLRRQAAMAEMQRLGIDQAGLGQFDADANFMDQLAGQQQAGTMANVDMQDRNMGDIGSMLESMSRGSRTSLVGKANVAQQEAVNDIRGDTREQLMDIFDSMREVRKGRPAAVNELWTQMQQNAYQQWAETQQMNFQNQLATNQFNLDVSEHNSSNLWKRAKLRQDAKREQAKRRQQRQLWAIQNASNSIMDAAQDMNFF